MNPVQSPAPPPEPDTVATLLTERAELQDRVAELEAENDRLKDDLGELADRCRHKLGYIP